MELLKNFYRKAHPPGLWKPVRLAIAAEDGQMPKTPKMLIPAGFMVAVIGAVWLCCAVICLSFLFVANWKSAGLYGGIGVVFAFVFKYAFKWHIGRMSEASSFSPNSAFVKK